MLILRKIPKLQPGFIIYKNWVWHYLKTRRNKRFVKIKYWNDVSTEELKSSYFDSSPIKTGELRSEILVFYEMFVSTFFEPVSNLFYMHFSCSWKLYLELLGLRECPNLSCSLATANKQLPSTLASCLNKRSKSKTTLLITPCGWIWRSISLKIIVLKTDKELN